MKTINKKILIVSNSSWSIYKFRLSLINFLDNNNFDVIACAIHDEEYKKKINKNAKFYSFNSNKKFKLKLINEIYIFIKFSILILKIRPSICLFFTAKPNIIFSISSIIFKRKYINNITGLGSIFLKKNKVLKIFFNFLYKISLSRSKYIFFQNNDDYNYFINNKLCKKDISKVIPGSGINTNIKKFYKTKINDGKKYFLCLSRLIRDKGIYEYIEASKIINEKYNNIEFKLIGNIDYNNPSSIKEVDLYNLFKNSKIIYKNFQENVYDEINKCDCIILPSYREGLSRTLLEAGILKKPAITTNVPGCRDVIYHNYNGLICEPMNAEDLAKKIEIFINMKDSNLKQMGINAFKNVVNKFDEKIILNHYIDVIKDE